MRAWWGCGAPSAAAKRRPGRLVLVLLALPLLGGPSLAQESPAAGDAVGPRLPPHVRAMLLEEMSAALAATQRILDALVRGEDAIVAEEAQAIHDSFILAQQMTDADREALLAAVPPDFITRDRAFHELAASLAAAGRDGAVARQRALFGAMVEACAGCHARHAANLFPGFVE